MEVNKTPSTIVETRPIVEFFEIKGLFDNRTVSFQANCAATVLIARNGSGKTTLLAALDAFLRGQFTKFSTLQFESISCKLLNIEKHLTITKSDVEDLTDLSRNSELLGIAKAWEVEPLALLELLESGVTNKGLKELRDNPTYYAIYTKLSYDSQVTQAQLQRLSSVLSGKNKNIDEARVILKDSLKDIEIVYLPTYRRIELSLPEVD